MQTNFKGHLLKLLLVLVRHQKEVLIILPVEIEVVENTLLKAVFKLGVLVEQFSERVDEHGKGAQVLRTFELAKYLQGTVFKLRYQV